MFVCAGPVSCREKGARRCACGLCGEPDTPWSELGSLGRWAR